MGSKSYGEVPDMSKINIGPGVLRIGDSEPLYCDNFKPIDMGLVTKSYAFTGTVDNFQLTFMTRVKLFGLWSAIKDEIRNIKRKKEIKNESKRKQSKS